MLKGHSPRFEMSLHKSVEARHLGNDHQAASADESTKVRRGGVKVLDLGPSRFVLVEFFGFLASSSNESDFGTDLCFCRAFIDLRKDLLCLLESAMVDKLSW